MVLAFMSQRILAVKLWACRGMSPINTRRIQVGSELNIAHEWVRFYYGEKPLKDLD